MFFRILQYSRKHLCQSLFLSCNFIWHRGFPFNFVRYLWMTASVLQQLLSLYFAIIYNWQLSSIKKSIVGKKTFIHMFQGFYRFRFLLHTHIYIFSISLTNASLLCRLRKAYNVLWATNGFVGLEALKQSLCPILKI